MGCNSSKLDDEEAVRLCKDRKKSIKQAVEYRVRFASGHIAYIQALKRVTAALRDYIEIRDEDEVGDALLLDSYKKKSNNFITTAPRCFSAPRTIQSDDVNKTTCVKISYYRPEGNPYVSVEERPPLSPETVQLQTYNNSSSSMLYNSYSGIDGFFTMESSPSSSSNPYSFSNRQNTRVPPSPSDQSAAQWDFFWNPFSSLDYYGNPISRSSSLEQSVNIVDDDINGLRHVREAEGIPELEDETDDDEHEEIIRDQYHHHLQQQQRKNVITNETDDKHEDMIRDQYHHHHVQQPQQQQRKNVITEENSSTIRRDVEEVVTVEDVDVDDDDETDCFEDECKDYEEEEEEEVIKGIQTHGSSGSRETELSPRVVNVHRHESVAVGERGENREAEAPGFTVYVNRRPTSMEEVIKDLETQFMKVCDSAKQVSSLLEARSAQYLLSASNESSRKMLNPVALFRSASYRSSSSRCLVRTSSSGFRDEVEEEEAHESSSYLCGTHQSTLDRLYAWEKRLYTEVRAGERIRLAYEKKCKQLRKQDMKGDDSSSMDKTRSTIRDLHTQIKVAIHSIEAISKRIEALRDEELHPQLVELVQGLSRMWKVMAECHQTQKRTLDNAKVMLAGGTSFGRRRKRNSNNNYDGSTSSRIISSVSSSMGNHHLSNNRLLACSVAASRLETEIRNWKCCFETWVSSQRSYVHALTRWLLRCAPDAAVSKSPDLQYPLSSSPSNSGWIPPIFGICIQWSWLIDGLREAPVLDGLHFFAAGMGSISAHQMMEDSSTSTSSTSTYRRRGGSNRYHGDIAMDLIEYGKKGDRDDGDNGSGAGMTPEKLAEVGVRVLCAGMSVAVSSLTEFAVASAQGYAELIHAKWPPTTVLPPLSLPQQEPTLSLPQRSPSLPQQPSPQLRESSRRQPQVRESKRRQQAPPQEQPIRSRQPPPHELSQPSRSRQPPPQELSQPLRSRQPPPHEPSQPLPRRHQSPSQHERSRPQPRQHQSPSQRERSRRPRPSKPSSPRTQQPRPTT